MTVKSSKWEVTKTTAKATMARLFFLSASSGQVLSANPDGSDLKVIVSEGRKIPDGIVVDVAAGHIYWTNMGNPSANDGSIERANLDGSKIETLVDTSQGEARPGKEIRKWCVGIALDVDGGKLYWTQKGPDNAGEGRIFRANLEIPQGQTPANRKDIELLFDGLPEPIDLDLDLANRTMYWTDRGDPPRGNTVNRAPMDPKPGVSREPEIVFTHLMEGIGLALDLTGGRMFITDLGGSVYGANLDGSDKKALFFAEGNLSGIAYAEIPVSS